MGLPVVADDMNGFGEFSINEFVVDTLIQPYIVSKVAVV